MKYILVIKLSRREIQFTYHRDDDPTQVGRLVPIDSNEPSLPLALYVDGERVELSANARLMAQRGVEGYYDDVLRLLTSERRFAVAGKEYGFLGLLLLAIESRLSTFYSQVLMGERGTLAENRATMPLAFMMDYSVPQNVRAAIVNRFRVAGYNAVMSIDELKLLLEQAAAVKGYDNVMLIDMDGDDLYCHLYRTATGEVDHLEPMAGVGRDPRVEQLAAELWQGAGGVHFQDTRATAEVEVPLLRLAAEHFIAQGVGEIYDEPYKTATGRTCYLNVNNSFLANLNSVGNQPLLNAIDEALVRKGVPPAGCALFLTGRAASDFVSQAVGRQFTVFRADPAVLDSQLVAKGMGGAVLSPNNAPMAGNAGAAVDSLRHLLGELQPLKARYVSGAIAVSRGVGEASEAAIEVLRRTTDRYADFDRYAAKFDEARNLLRPLASAIDEIKQLEAKIDVLRTKCDSALATVETFGYVPEVEQLSQQLTTSFQQVNEAKGQLTATEESLATVMTAIKHFEEVFPQYRVLRDQLDAATTYRDKDELWQRIAQENLTMEPCPVPLRCRLAASVSTVKSGFFGLKKERTLVLDIQVLDDKTLPFATRLIVQSQPLVVFNPAVAFVQEFDAGLTGLTHLELPMPLAGVSPQATKLYLYFKPGEGLDQNTLLDCRSLTISLT